MEIINVPLENLTEIRELAYKIWPIVYSSILSKKQLEYMLDEIYSLDSLEKQLTKENQQFIIVQQENTSVAFASFSMIRAHDNNTCKLHKLYVSIEEQGKGIGRLIINHISQKIKSPNPSYIILNVNRHNKAVDFYKHLGFSIIKEEDIDIGNGYFMNDYVMGKFI